MCAPENRLEFDSAMPVGLERVSDCAFEVGWDGGTVRQVSVGSNQFTVWIVTF